MDPSLAALLTRHQTDGDVFSEIQATADSSMQVPPTMTACNGRRNPGRPLLASSVSLSDGLLYPSSADMSVEPRFNSDPTHLNEILSSLHIAQNMHPMVLTRPSTYQQQQQSSAGMTSTGPDRRTLSLGDFSAFTASLQQHTMPGGHRKLSDAATLSWDGTTPIADSAQNPAPQRYKTELCRPYEENGTCRYGTKCQFAHGKAELRTIARHPKYKTEMCRTFHTTGYCPYGPRCHFIHNDEAVDQVPSSQHPQSLSRQSSTSSTVGGVVEHASSAATVARDSERRRVQLMHSQSRRSRTTIAETPNEIELASEWLAESEAIDQPQSSYATTASAQSSIWLTAAAAPLPASSSSSPISSTSTADQLVHYMVDPPPGLPIPAAVSNRSSPRSNGGISPTYDTMSMTGSGLGDTSASATPAIFSPLSLSTAGRRCSTVRPVLSAPFYADERVQLTSTTSRFQIGNDTPISVAVHHQNDRQPSPTGSVDSVWFSSNSNVSDRRAAFRSTSTWAGQSINHSFDDIGSNSSSVSVSSNDEDDAHDIRQTVASFSTDQWKLLVDLVKTYAPATAFSPMSDNTTLTPSMPSTVDTWKISRSMSIADPSTMTSHPVDNLHWTSHRATTPANFASALASNRAAGVCG